MPKTSSAPTKPKVAATPTENSASRPLPTRSLRGVTAVPVVERASPFAIGALGFACVLCVLAPQYGGQFWPATNDFWPQTYWLGALSSVFFLLLLARAEIGRFTVSSALLLGFGAWCALSVFGAAYLHDALLELARIVGVIGSFFAFRALLRAHAFAALWLLAALVAGSVWVALGALWSYSVLPTREFGTFFNPNLYATWNAMTLPMALALALECVRRTREADAWKWGALMSALAGFLIAGGLVVTGSKGGFLAELLALLVFAGAILRARGTVVVRAMRSHARVVVPFLLLICVAGGAIGVKTVLPRLLAARGSEDNSTMFRAYTWRGTLQMANARPFTGWGAGAFPSVYEKFAQAGETRSAHQSWLQLASECGWLAPLLLLSGAGAAAFGGFKRLRTKAAWPLQAGALSMATALVAHGFTDDGWKIIAPASAFMFALALLDGGEENGQCKMTNGQFTMKEGAPKLRPAALLNFAFCVFHFAFCIFCFRAAQAATLWHEADAMAHSGAPTFAVGRADAAVQLMPLSARAQFVRAWSLAAGGDVNGARQAFARAQALQPTLAAHPFNLARLLVERAPQENRTIAANFDRAESLSPNDTDILLARGAWRLSRSDARGWRDYERVAQLADAPYGRYPALGTAVNLDFSRAYLKLAQRAATAGDSKAMNTLLQRARADLARAKGDEAMLFYRAQESSGQSGAVAARESEVASLENEAEQISHR